MISSNDQFDFENPTTLGDFEEYVMTLDISQENLEQAITDLFKHIGSNRTLGFQVIQQMHTTLDIPKEELTNIYNSVNRYRRNHITNEVIENFEFIEIFQSYYYVKCIEESGEMLLYNDGVYDRNKERRIRALITEELRNLDQKYSKRLENDLISLLRSQTLVSIKDFDKDHYILNLDNGLLNILTEEFKDHNPEYLSFRRIPITYNPDIASCEIDNFLIEIFHKEDINVIIEFMGLCLTPIMIYQIAVLLYGIGMNGKTTFLSFLQMFIGEQNSANIDISNFRKDPLFAQIEGKLLNVVADIDTNTKIDIQRFKDFVGNALLITINKKYKDPYSINPTAKNIYSCNSTFPEIPANTDKGYWRKWFFIECPRSFDKNEDAHKLESLLNENDKSGFLNKCIKGFQRLHKRGRFEEEYYNWELIKDTWIENKNVVQEYIKEEYIEDPQSYVIQKDFVNEVNKWLKEKGRIPLYSGTITKKINSNPSYQQDRKRINGKIEKIYRGFRSKKIEKIEIEKFLEGNGINE